MISIDPAKCIGCRLCVEECVVMTLKAGQGNVPVVADFQSCIRCQHCLAVCPAGAVSVDGIAPETIAPLTALPSSESMLSLLRSRRSIRRFQDKCVPPDVFAALENALRFSPTGCNDHRLRFVIVKKKETMDEFRALNRRQIDFFAKCGLCTLFPKIGRFLAEPERDLVFRGAPGMIVALTPKNAPCADVDPVIALTQFELYAATFGIGCCWCGFAVHAMRLSRTMRKMLQVPRGYKIGYVLLFGYPATSFARPASPPAVPVVSL